LRGELGEFVELLPAHQRIETSWYEGTANAVLQNLDIIKSHGPEYVLILAGVHVYKIDYGTMLAAHVEQEADITVGCIEVPLEEASADRKSTRLNSSHVKISYAVFCLKKKRRK